MLRVYQANIEANVKYQPGPSDLPGLPGLWDQPDLQRPQDRPGLSRRAGAALP